MGSQINNDSRKMTSGRLAKNFTWFAYACGPLIAVAFETRMCSTKKAPTGTIPVSECSRRQKNSCPWPARMGWTPDRGEVVVEAAKSLGSLCAVLSVVREGRTMGCFVLRRTFDY